MIRVLLMSIIALLSGCSCVDYRVIDLDARAKLDERRRFIVMATTLTGEVFTDLPTAAAALETHYSRGASAWSVRPIEDAPGWLASALRGAREELLAAGYLPATEAVGAGAADLVVVMSVTHHPSNDSSDPRSIGAITRVAVDVGGPIDGEYERVLVSIDARPDEGCDVVAEELVREMVGALPGPGDEKDAEKLEREEGR